MQKMLSSLSLLFVGLFMLSGCGSSNNTAQLCASGQVWNGSSCAYTSTSLTQTGVNSCVAGQVYTAQGCLVQGSCPANQGWNGSACLVAQNTNGTCGVGQVYTQLGCLGQGGPCLAGQGWNPQSNTCLASLGGTNYNYNNQNGPYNNGGQYYGYQNGGYTGQCATAAYAMTANGCMPRCQYNYNNGNCVNY